MGIFLTWSWLLISAMSVPSLPEQLSWALWLLIGVRKEGKGKQFMRSLPYFYLSIFTVVNLINFLKVNIEICLLTSYYLWLFIYGGQILPSTQSQNKQVLCRQVPNWSRVMGFLPQAAELFHAYCCAQDRLFCKDAMFHIKPSDAVSSFQPWLKQCKFSN